MVLGLLLARAGIDVTVLEKHADFLRDFRGDTVHPTTMRLLDELGLWERFAALPHSKVEQAAFDVSPGRSVALVDFRRLRQPHPYVAMVPQWDLLNLLAEAGEAEPTFTLRMRAEVTGLLREEGKITGVRYQSPSGPGELRAELTVGCDGRGSLARREGGLKPREYPVPFDVWWFRLPRDANATFTLFPRTAPGKALIVIPREGYLQIAFLIPKGSDARLRARGLDAFRRDVVELMPEASESVQAVTSLDDVKHLDVRITGCTAGTPMGCFASATPRTRCLPPAAWASTSRFKTPSPPPPCWPNHCGSTGSPVATLAPSAGTACSPRRWHRRFSG